MQSKYSLLAYGLFPEVLPPCFSSADSRRALRGKIGLLEDRRYWKRPTDYVRYSATKHDGNRRSFGTPNLVSYYYVSEFIFRHWKAFSSRFENSIYSVGAPRPLPDGSDRAVQVPSLSELSGVASHNLRHAPLILKADVAQFYASIYTHSIPWSAHGVDNARLDTEPSSKTLRFNALDFFVRNCQQARTRGVLIGPDGFRLVAEFIAAGLDRDLSAKLEGVVVGAARHVDDYYMGLESEAHALIALSTLREVLGAYELQLNDAKTRVYPSLQPINDLWAQELRDHLERRISFLPDREDSASSMNIMSTLVTIGASSKNIFSELFSGTLIRSTTSALEEEFDVDGWTRVIENGTRRNLAYNHHHEIVWLLWLALALKTRIGPEMVDALAKSENSHIRALLAAAHVSGQITRKPKLALGNKLSTDQSNWLVNLVARAQGYSRAPFSGPFTEEFEHLAARKICLIDLDSPLVGLRRREDRSISRARYGYDLDPTDEPDDDLTF